MCFFGGLWINCSTLSRETTLGESHGSTVECVNWLPHSASNACAKRDDCATYSSKSACEACSPPPGAVDRQASKGSCEGFCTASPTLSCLGWARTTLFTGNTPLHKMIVKNACFYRLICQKLCATHASPPMSRTMREVHSQLRCFLSALHAQMELQQQHCMKALLLLAQGCLQQQYATGQCVALPPHTYLLLYRWSICKANPCHVQPTTQTVRDAVTCSQDCNRSVRKAMASQPGG